jgi:AraC-like DNA-binding protein
LRLTLGAGAEGIERVAVRLRGLAYAPHRHDTYAIGVTLAGVQTFRYRGRRRVCLPGEGHVLHPDEMHDGGAGTEDGFAYAILYIDPALVQEALGGRALPFVADPVIGRAQMDPTLVTQLRRIDEPLGDVGRVDLAVAVAATLQRHAGGSAPRPSPLPWAELLRVRELILEDPTVRHRVEALERIAGLDRWTLARRFRQAFGTSPSRFCTMRRLDRARRMMLAGMPQSAVALESGFTDQSHMARSFKRTYGLTPAAWTAAARGQAPGSSAPG